MRICVQRGGIMNPPDEYSGVDSVVITTDEGDPIVVATSVDRAVCVATLNDSNFEEYMTLLGYKKEDIPKADIIETQ